MERKVNSGISGICRYVAAWCTKYKRPVLSGSIKEELEELIHGVCSEMDVTVVSLKVDADAVEMTVETDPTCSIHKIVKQLKRVTSHDLREKYPELRSRIPTLWTNQYYATTAGVEDRERLKEFVSSQPTKQ